MMQHIHLIVLLLVAFRPTAAQSCGSLSCRAGCPFDRLFDLCVATEGCAWNSTEHCNSPDGLNEAACCVDVIETTAVPTAEPTLEPTFEPTLEPTEMPTTDQPTTSPTMIPTSSPSADPTAEP